MNSEKFTLVIKESICTADWHRRYFSEMSAKYSRIDYWLRCSLGIFGLIGAGIVTVSDNKIGGVLAGMSAFVFGNVLPLFKWGEIVSGFKEETDAWTRIHQGYENIGRLFEVADRGEILLQEFQNVKAQQDSAAVADRKLPKNEKLLDRLEKEVRGFYARKN